MFTVGQDDLIPLEAVVKTNVFRQPLDRNHAFDRISKKPRLAGTFFLPLYKFRGTQGELPHSGKRGGLGHAQEFMVLANSILCVLHELSQVEILLFDRSGGDDLIPPM